MSRQNKRAATRWRAVFVASITILVLALCALVLILFSYFYGQKQYDDLKKYIDVSDKSLSDMTIDWEALRAINPDIVGWIYIPDTVVSYPIVWKSGDSSYYLTHNFNNRSSLFGAEYGCIFLSGDNREDFSDNSNFIYGHNMYNGTVFSVFSDNQGNSEWFNSHRTIFILTPTNNYKCETYAQNKVDGSATNIAYSSFSTQEELSNYVDERRSNSIVTASPTGEASENMTKLFSFSTCSSPDSNKRIITFSSSVESSKDREILSVKDAENVTNDLRSRIE